MEWCSRVLHHGNPKMWIFLKSWKLTKLNSVRTPSFHTPRKEIALGPWLCQYQSYISNWYVNGKVFEYYNMGTKNLIFFSKKFEIEFDMGWRAEINIQVGLTYMSTSVMHRRPFEGRHLVNFGKVLVITCSSPWKPKNLIFFFLMSEIWILTCDEELNSP